MIPVILIAKFKKSEVSIRAANKMDNMDRTWKWLTNLIIRICIRKAIELSEHVNGKVRIVMRISFKVVYYLVIASVAYITTRDQGDFQAESDLS